MLLETWAEAGPNSETQATVGDGREIPGDAAYRRVPRGSADYCR